MEVHRVARRRGSQKAVRLSALRAGHHRPPPIPGGFQVLISVGGWVDPRVIVRLEGLCQFKNPMTSSGIKPATFQLVAQCLNQLRHHTPLKVPRQRRKL
jgi:hypothetical protein